MQLTTYQEYLETKTKYMYICTTVYFFGNPVVFIQKLTQPNHGLESFTNFCPYVFFFTVSSSIRENICSNTYNIYKC